MAFIAAVLSRVGSGAALSLLALSLILLGNAGLSGQEAPSQNVRVAGGEYKVYKQTNVGGIGPYSPSVFDFKESWTLWREPHGDLEVVGQRDYASPSDVPHSDKFTVHLSSDFRVISLREFRKLRWSPDSGPLDCQFLTGRLACTSNAADPQKNVTLDLPLQDAYGFLWPISAFSLSHITRFVSHTRGSVIPVQMLSLEETSAEDPVNASVLEGHLAYWGHETITAAGRKWSADKFTLTLPLHAPFLIWTSPAGLLLDFAEEDNHGHLKERGMMLLRYQQWLDY
ncbi:MAG: hypothetical protein WCA15_13035 [Candidatus Acidiferrales bacterium]